MDNGRERVYYTRLKDEYEIVAVLPYDMELPPVSLWSFIDWGEKPE